MLQGQLVLAHLRKDCTDVKVDISGVKDLKAIVNTFLAEVQVVVLDLKGLLEVAESRPQLLGSSENAGKVVVSNCSVLVSIVGQCLSFAEKLQGNVEVFYLS